MKNCQQIAALASAYADGELSGVEWAELRMHLWLCPPCRKYVEQIELTREVLEKLPTDEVPQEVQSELLGRFKQWVADGAPAEDDPFDE
ncbi:MAG: hypothetical protein EP330_02385 [Deltaproteobacteria bacterium]|nr:MAG: hypothetical protein EP330_02385 [Deltaproteobacteria bacterium]